MSSLLAVNDLVAGYAADLPIVTGVSLTVSPGELVTIIGPNGAGKSTLIKAMAGLVTVMGGRVELDGGDITGIQTHKLPSSGIGYVAQSANIFTTLTVQENFRASGHTLGRDMHDRIAEAYEIFPDLAPYKDKKGRVLSGGQRQMLALGMTLLCRPRVILLDEPSAGLAPAIVQDVFARLRGLADSGLALLMVEQNAHAALELSDRGYVMAEGAVKIEGGANDLLEDPQVAEIYLGKRRAQ
ncbi:MAG: ABC transporter ATP-binding protein [Pseudomonadota bacterium]